MTGQQRPHGALMTGPAGWVSGPMPDLPAPTIADVIAAYAHRGWQIAQTGAAVFTAEYRAGTRLHVLAAHSPADLAARIRDAELAAPLGPAPADLLAEIAAGHPTWAVDVADLGHGVTAQQGETRIWAASAEELSALLDVADPAGGPPAWMAAVAGTCSHGGHGYDGETCDDMNRSPG